MLTQKITVVNQPKISLKLTADDWELYSDYDDTGRYANRENVACALNDFISEAINTSEDMKRAFNRCLSILQKYSDSGANDTEGRSVLNFIFQQAYGKENLSF